MLYSSGTTGRPKAIKRFLQGNPFGTVDPALIALGNMFGIGGDTGEVSAPSGDFNGNGELDLGLFVLPVSKLYLPLPLFCFGIGGLFTIMMSMTADVCDLDELRHGARREGVFGAVYWWMVKLGFAVDAQTWLRRHREAFVGVWRTASRAGASGRSG